MANVALTVTPVVRTFPFVTPPGAEQPLTAVPIARITFNAVDTTIVAKIATNTTSISMGCPLPQNYAYTFEYATQRVTCLTDPADAGNFDDIGTLIFGFGDGFGARHCEFLSDGITGTLLNAGSTKIWAPVNPYVPPIYNQRSQNATLTLLLNDTDAGATVEGDYSAVLSLLQYDFAQAFNYPLNFPLPVTAR